MSTILATYRHALVTGASGFIGRALCTYLVRQGLQVTGVSRRVHRRPDLPDRQYQMYAADLAEGALPEAAWAGVDVVFHLAGMAHAGSHISDEAYHRANVEATDALLQQAVSHAVKRFVYFSSVKAISPTDRYGYSKRQAEAVALAYGAQKDVDVSVLRPALVYGPALKGNLRALKLGVKKGWLPPLPETGNQRSLIAVQDLVQAAWIAAQSPHTRNKVYAVSDGVSYSTRQIYEVFCRMLGRTPGRWAPPRWLFWLGAQLLFKSDLYEKLFGSAFYPDLSLSQDTGWEPQHTLWDVEQWARSGEG